MIPCSDKDDEVLYDSSRLWRLTFYLMIYYIMLCHFVILKSFWLTCFQDRLCGNSLSLLFVFIIITQNRFAFSRSETYLPLSAIFTFYHILSHFILSHYCTLHHIHHLFTPSYLIPSLLFFSDPWNKILLKVFSLNELFCSLVYFFSAEFKRELIP